ncbi:MAG: acetate--CoA ligase [Actinomycetia bacterium]|nr:acetate--CoA ligase [Actinomycetes bacterium]
MAWAVIPPEPQPVVAPHLTDYSTIRAGFSWDAARGWLDGLPDGGLNIVHEAVDRHVAQGRGARVALRFLGEGGVDRELTYAELAEQTARFADVLAGLGIGRGDRVFGLMGRLPDLYVAILGTLRRGAVFCPLFSAFGPEPVRQRLQLGHGRVLVTTPSLYRRKVAPIRDEVPDLEAVLLSGGGPGAADVPGGRDLAALLAAASPGGAVAATTAEDPALLHFTSGTTGRPKGAVHVHGAVVAHHMTARYVLDLHDDDVFWCTADPGWVTGTSYGVVAPLTCGVTCVVDEAELDVDRWYRILEEQRVTVWYTAPTALRMLMKAGVERVAGHDLSHVRHIASVGEPLNPEVVVWGQEAFGRPVHDTWWQTETGAIMIANYPGVEIRPGSMGRPVPGIEAALVARDADAKPLRTPDGGPVFVTDPDVEGELSLRAPWPSMMRAYLDEPERYAKAFVGEWYLTGDLARRDADGWFWFVGRGDDVIKSAGHLIGPFEVESALMEHPAVAEAGAIGVPDPMAGEVVKAFVALRPAYQASDELRLELIGFGRKRLGPAVAPRDIAFQQDLPKTRSGKIMRRLLKARELGLPEGDLSTLEGTSEGARQ